MKTIKITDDDHKLLMNYCKTNGLKVYFFIGELIKNKCIDTVEINKT